MPPVATLEDYLELVAAADTRIDAQGDKARKGTPHV